MSCLYDVFQIAYSLGAKPSGCTIATGYSIQPKQQHSTMQRAAGSGEPHKGTLHLSCVIDTALSLLIRHTEGDVLGKKSPWEYN